jgi:NDP-sugar pyrophosphorylase family protein
LKLLVLAGGLGTRLKSVLPDTPKALAPVGGKPFLELQIANWSRQGIRNMAFLVHHQADQIKEFLARAIREGTFSCSFDVVEEQTLLDTGGAVANAIHALHLSSEFLVTNADTWIGEGIEEMLSGPAPAIGVLKLDDTSRYGRVQLEKAGQSVCSFHEKNGQAELGWINAGIYRFAPQHFSGWQGERLSLEREVLPSLAQRGLLHARPLATEFIDIGIPSDYQRFCDLHGMRIAK